MLPGNPHQARKGPLFSEIGWFCAEGTMRISAVKRWKSEDLIQSSLLYRDVMGVL